MITNSARYNRHYRDLDLINEMSMQEICEHERLGMQTRQQHGYDQHDDHLWRWLNHHLNIWSAKRPLTISKEIP